MSASAQTPVLQYALLCDAVAKDQSGKAVFIGVFDQLLRPAPVAQFFIALKWILGLGEHQFKIGILDPNLNRIHEFPEVKMKFEKKTDAFQLQFQMINFNFAMPGVFWIEITLNGQTALSIPLPVQKGEQPKAVSGGPSA